jgi:gamma-D-glutamyl-L-lysine dipeptidyl-peptidase
MEFGICILSIAQVRGNPDERSELVTQLLFGETFKVVQKKGSWIEIEADHDNYQGWVWEGQVKEVDPGYYSLLNSSPRWISKDLVQILENKTRNTSMLVSAGSTFYNCSDHNDFELLGEHYHFHGTLHEPLSYERDQLAQNALLFLNAPYLWGGRSALGIDCSGFSQVVFKMSGLAIARDAAQQAMQGELINLIHESQSGDLVFFDNDEQVIIHVGILLDQDYVIHCHNQVRIDRIDHQGIFNQDTRKYSHKLRLIRRF